MPSSTVEDYIKQIYLLQQDAAGEIVPMGRLSVAMNITPGTTTTMVKGLAESGFVQYRPRTGVQLTDKGRDLAIGVLRRHRIAEAFLVDVLGMDWTEVHEDAERLEHAISDRVLERMDAFMNRPTHDPHGDPIPANDRTDHDAVRQRNLAAVPERASAVVARILDQSTAFLNYVKKSGLAPGATIKVAERNKMADSLHIEVKGGKRLVLSTRAAEKILVKT